MQFGYLIIIEDQILLKVVRRIGLIGDWPSGTKAVLCTARNANQHVLHELEKFKHDYLIHGDEALPKTIKAVFDDYFENGAKAALIPLTPSGRKRRGRTGGMPPGVSLLELKKDDPEWQPVRCEHCNRVMRRALWRKRHGDVCPFKGMKTALDAPAKDGRIMKVTQCEGCGDLFKGPSIGSHRKKCVKLKERSQMDPQIHPQGLPETPGHPQVLVE